jgi:hypothetical protein
MATKQKQESGFAETVRVIFHALLIALVIRTFKMSMQRGRARSQARTT